METITKKLVDKWKTRKIRKKQEEIELLKLELEEAHIRKKIKEILGE